VTAREGEVVPLRPLPRGGIQPLRSAGNRGMEAGREMGMCSGAPQAVPPKRCLSHSGAKQLQHRPCRLCPGSPSARGEGMQPTTARFLQAGGRVSSTVIFLVTATGKGRPWENPNLSRPTGRLSRAPIAALCLAGGFLLSVGN